VLNLQQGSRLLVPDLKSNLFSKVGKKNKELLNCEGCMSVRYCGAKCQKEDWMEHKTKCKQLNEQRLKSKKAVPATAAKKSEGLCASCGTNEAKSSCSVCKVTRYCSRECQTKHWKEHKPVCKK
jgi:hypothetical protein